MLRLKRYWILYVFSLILITVIACNRNNVKRTKDQALHQNCFVEPDPGPCRMAINRYYFDEKDKKCKRFIYGGCKGVIPFETLEECQKACGCEEVTD